MPKVNVRAVARSFFIDPHLFVDSVHPVPLERVTDVSPPPRLRNPVPVQHWRNHVVGCQVDATFDLNVDVRQRCRLRGLRVDHVEGDGEKLIGWRYHVAFTLLAAWVELEGTAVLGRPTRRVAGCLRLCGKRPNDEDANEGCTGSTVDGTV